MANEAGLPDCIGGSPETAWAWLRYLVIRKMHEETPERAALWHEAIADAREAFARECGE